MSKMLPCPKCRHPKSRTISYDGDTWRVCEHCGMSTSPCRSSYLANKEWNDRTRSPKAARRVK